MKVTFETSLAQVRVVIVAFSFVILSGCPSPSVLAASGVSSGNSTDKVLLYVNQGETANLKCEVNLETENRSISPAISWSKVRPDSISDKSNVICENTTSSNDDKYKCKVSRAHKRHKEQINDDSSEEDKSEGNGKFMVSELKIDDVDDEDYGNYICNVAWGSGNPDVREIELKDTIKVTRKSSEGKTHKGSLIIEEGEVLYLYCNVTPPLTDGYKVSWLFLPEPESDEVQKPKNITDELLHTEDSELFQNFTRTYPNASEFHGVVEHSHRGNFTCSVDLKNPSEVANYNDAFPVNFTLRVRVRDSNRIMLPGLIVLGEVIGLAIFTAFIWRKVDGIEGGVDGDYADSDDEDNDQKKLK